MQRQAVIVGYGTEGTDESTVFGWVIGPQQMAGDTGNRNSFFRHQPTQNSLTALISLPSWWDHLKLDVSCSWINQPQQDKKNEIEQGKLGEKSCTTTTNQAEGAEQRRKEIPVVQLPVDYATLEKVLLETEGVGPEIAESVMDPIVLSLCRPAAILLPGKRLWRSAVVTVGSQRANNIVVLPDMKGIIANFKNIQLPGGWTDLDKNYLVPVTVWTSEGNTTLANKARIVAQPSQKKYWETYWKERGKCPLKTPEDGRKLRS
jgi:hypothetical protein